MSAPARTSSPTPPALPRFWSWDDKRPFCLRACSSVAKGYCELWANGNITAQNAPREVIDALYARFDELVPPSAQTPRKRRRKTAR